MYSTVQLPADSVFHYDSRDCVNSEGHSAIDCHHMGFFFQHVGFLFQSLCTVQLPADWDNDSLLHCDCTPSLQSINSDLWTRANSVLLSEARFPWPDWAWCLSAGSSLLWFIAAGLASGEPFIMPQTFSLRIPYVISIYNLHFLYLLSCLYDTQVLS